jgi:chromosome segregation ATPase
VVEVGGGLVSTDKEPIMNIVRLTVTACAVALVACERSPAQVAEEKAKERREYQEKQAELNQREASEQAKVQREFAEERAEAKSELAQAEARLDEQRRDEADRGGDRNGVVGDRDDKVVDRTLVGDKAVRETNLGKDAVTEREIAAAKGNEKLEKLEARVGELKTRIGALPTATRGTYQGDLDRLNGLRESTAASIASLKGSSVSIDSGKQSVDNWLKAYEKAVDQLEARIDKTVDKVSPTKNM